MITNRIELAKHFRDLGFTKGAEIGVADGRYSEILCETIPNLKLYCVDPWAEYDGNWRSSEYQEKAYQRTAERVVGYKATLIKSTSVEASLKINEELDFVFIDGAHDFDNVMLDVILWSRKVKKAGIVAGHDYYQFHNSGIIESVNAYIQKHNLDLNLTLANSAKHKDDQCPCWWFIKK